MPSHMCLCDADCVQGALAYTCSSTSNSLLSWGDSIDSFEVAYLGSDEDRSSTTSTSLR